MSAELTSYVPTKNALAPLQHTQCSLAVQLLISEGALGLQATVGERALLVRLLPLRSRPPLPVYRNHSPSSLSSSYLHDQLVCHGRPC